MKKKFPHKKMREKFQEPITVNITQLNVNKFDNKKFWFDTRKSEEAGETLIKLFDNIRKQLVDDGKSPDKIFNGKLRNQRYFQLKLVQHALRQLVEDRKGKNIQLKILGWWTYDHRYGSSICLDIEEPDDSITFLMDGFHQMSKEVSLRLEDKGAFSNEVRNLIHKTLTK